MSCNHFFPLAHTKLAASLVSPEPLYFTAYGYGHRRRVILTPCAGLESFTYLVAMILEGATLQVSTEGHFQRDFLGQAGGAVCKPGPPLSDFS